MAAHCSTVEAVFRDGIVWISLQISPWEQTVLYAGDRSIETANGFSEKWPEAREAIG